MRHYSETFFSKYVCFTPLPNFKDVSLKGFFHSLELALEKGSRDEKQNKQRNKNRK